jgi:hypothetical protein
MVGAVEQLRHLLATWAPVADNFLKLVGVVALVVTLVKAYRGWRTSRVHVDMWLTGPWTDKLRTGDMFVKLYNNSGADVGVDGVGLTFAGSF